MKNILDKCACLSFLLLMVLDSQSIHAETSFASSQIRSSAQQLNDTQMIIPAEHFGIGDDRSRLGFSVDVEGQLAAVGAPGAMGHGLVFLYQYDGTSWQHTDTLLPDDGQQGDMFGYAVDVEANRIVIGANESRVGFDELGAVYVFEFEAQTMQWNQSAKLMASDASRNDRFGSVIQQSADQLIIAAFNKVYVFNHTVTGWVEQQIISNGGSFGADLKLIGNQLMVGANTARIEGVNNAGAVWIYENNLGNWEFSEMLTASDFSERSSFGVSIDANEDLMVIGANRDGRHFIGQGPGTVYVFESFEGGWQETSRITIDNHSHLDLMGSTVMLDGSTILASAVADATVGNFDAYVYAFQFNNGFWESTDQLTLTGSENADMAVALSSGLNQLIVGFSGHDSAGFETGQWMQYAANDGSFSLTQQYDMFPGSAMNQFGNAVSISGTHAMLGAYGDDTAGLDTGAVYSYLEENGTWVFGQKLIADDAGPLDNFGYSIDVNGSRAIIGAPSINASEAGSAYVFEFDGSVWNQVAKLEPDDGLGGDYFGVSVRIHNGLAVVGATGSDTFGDRSGAAYLFRLEAQDWQLVKRLHAPNLSEGDWYGVDVEITDEWIMVGQLGQIQVFNAQNNWQHQQSILGFSDSLGSTLDMDGDRLVSGDYVSNNPNGGRGFVYVYQLVDMQWEFEQLLNPNFGSPDFFGVDVSISGDQVLVGSSWDHGSGVFYSGAVYWFAREAEGWVQRRLYHADQPHQYDLLGWSVSLDGERALIGVPGLDEFGTNSGGAYQFVITDVIFQSGFDSQ
jgi:hypothetical protein